MLFGPNDADGWRPLFDSITKDDLACQALSRSSRFSIDGQRNVYKSILNKDEGRIDAALLGLMKCLHPRFVGKEEFERALRSIPAKLLGLPHSCNSIVFALEVDVLNEIPSIKSNLWVFLRIMKMIEKMLGKHGKHGKHGKVAFEEFASRTWVMAMPVDDDDVKIILPPLKGPTCLVVADDCVYSGKQIGEALNRFHKNGFVVSEAIVCPAFATMQGLKNIIDRNPEMPLMLMVPNIIGYAASVAVKLAQMDVVICISPKKRNGSWIVTTLFQILGIVRHFFEQGNEPTGGKHSDNVMMTIQGKCFSCMSTMMSVAAVAFSHKLADSFSVPTDLFLFGLTLRALIEDACPGLKKVSLVLTDIQTFLDAFNGNVKPEFNISQLTGCYYRCTDKMLGKILTHEQHDVDIASMPVFAPLLYPMDACGKKLRAARDMVNLNLGDLKTSFEDALSNKTDCRCAVPAYKHKIKACLNKLNAKGKCRGLALALLSHPCQT